MIYKKMKRIITFLHEEHDSLGLMYAHFDPFS